MPLLGSFWQAAPLLLVLSSLSSVIGVSISALLAAESPAGTGTTMVLNGSILNLGGTGGAALGGALIAFGGYNALLVGLPVFALGAAMLALWPARRH
jgi:predicted MFS family arabinose efflux permease